MSNNNTIYDQEDISDINITQDDFDEVPEDSRIYEIIQQLGVFERYILHRYKHQKAIYVDADLLSKHPQDIANDLQDEVINYQYTYGDGDGDGDGDHIKIITSYDDYLYLRDELLKNPFEIGTMPEELLFTYMFCLCKDARELLWNIQIDQCYSLLRQITYLYTQLNDLFISLYNLWSLQPTETPYSNVEILFYSTFAQQRRYQLSPDYEPSLTIPYLNRKKQGILTGWYSYLLKKHLSEIAKENGKWSSLHAAIKAVATKNGVVSEHSSFGEILTEQSEQNQKYAIEGRNHFIGLYTCAYERLKKELKENAWLSNHSHNKERYTLATERLEQLHQLIEEQEELLETYDSEHYSFLKRKCYGLDTLKSWIKDDKEFLKQIIHQAN